MSIRAVAFGGCFMATLSCNQAPPVPENPKPFGAPDFGTTTTQGVSPPPISGGTLLVSHDGKKAIAADSDRDLVTFVDLASAVVQAQSKLSRGDEPGRLVEDNGGNVYVALRGSGELATFSLASGQLLERRPVCAQPRGVAYDGTLDQIVVVCATGELVTFPTGLGPALQTVVVEPDLRDVVVEGASLFISKFRTAEILRTSRNGSIVQRVALPSDLPGHTAALAWRMRETQDHRLFVTYQLDSTSFISTTPGGYGNSGPGGIAPGPLRPVPVGGGGPIASSGGGGGVVVAAVATLSTTDMTVAPAEVQLGAIVLPVDLALSPAQADTATVVIAAANWRSKIAPAYTTLAAAIAPAAVDGQLIAAEIAVDGTILLQSREPARLYVVKPGRQNVGDQILNAITLSDVSRDDTGHAIFHTNSGTGLACASCHGEGGDDAQTWNFNGVKARRTPSLLGTVKGTAPYHWDADFADLTALAHEVYTRRMGGALLRPDQLSALKGWLEQLPAPRRPPVVDDNARARGKALFEGKAGCSTCHSGSSYTNNATMDVGTGGAFQVPPLVGVGARAPLLHAGCATTLLERFTKCGTPAHANATTLQGTEIQDLVVFLETL